MKTTTTCQTCGRAIPETPLNSADYGPALCVTCRYDSAPPKAAKAQDCPAYQFAVETISAPEAAQSDESEDNSEFAAKLAAFLEWLAADGSPKTAGKKAILLSYVAGRTSWQTDAEAAKAIGVSKGRMSQLRAEIESVLPGFGRCNRRQN